MRANRSEQRRILTHVFLGGVTALLSMFLIKFVPPDRQGTVLVIALGYASLVLICLGLLVGPFNLLFQRSNPVNIDLRRDLGIWAGIMGCWHVLLVLRGILPRGEFLLYFLRQNGRGGYEPLWTIFGLSNDTGLFATVLLCLLLALSNTYSLRKLKGKRWKQLQRLTYLLLILVVVHTFGYQYLDLRGPVLVFGVVTLLGVVCLIQAWGIVLTLSRRKRRGTLPERVEAKEAIR